MSGMDAPELTVIVAIQDGRGQEEHCIRRLAREQTLGRDRYELVVIAPDLEPDQERQISELLGATDQLVRQSSLNEFVLYNAAAELARGRVLFFIEAHCVAEESCLEEILDFLAAHDVAGASCRSVGSARNHLARREQELFEPSLSELLDPDHWYKVLIHGFAIEREVFRSVGGFDHRLGNFAEVALAATLDDVGFRLGYAPRAMVTHHYLGGLRELFAYIRDFTQGEMRFRATESPVYCARYVDPAPEWTDRRSFERPVAAGLAKAAAVAARTEASSATRPRRRRLGLFANRHWTRAIAGDWLLLAGAAAALAWRWAGALLWRGRGNRGFDAYLAWWRAVIRFSRLEYLHRHRDQVGPAGAGPPGSRFWNLEQPGDRDLAGFHGLEQWQGHRFRWTGALAMVELDLPAARYTARLESLPIRPLGEPPHPLLVINGTVIEPNAGSAEATAIEFALEPEMFRAGRGRDRLTLVCDPVPRKQLSGGERRPLGLPLSSIALEPCDGDSGVSGAGSGSPGFPYPALDGRDRDRGSRRPEELSSPGARHT